MHSLTVPLTHTHGEHAQTCRRALAKHLQSGHNTLGPTQCWKAGTKRETPHMFKQQHSHKSRDKHHSSQSQNIHACPFTQAHGNTTLKPMLKLETNPLHALHKNLNDIRPGHGKATPKPMSTVGTSQQQCPPPNRSSAA